MWSVLVEVGEEDRLCLLEEVEVGLLLVMEDDWWKGSLVDLG